MKFIEIGDMHVKKDNIEESVKFIDWIVDIINELKKKEDNLNLIFLGDQFNDFGVARVEVINFWTSATHKLSEILPKNKIHYLVGNHDRNSEGTESAMFAFWEKGNLIDKKGKILYPKIGAIGFIRSNEEFLKETMNLYSNGVKTIYCHQEFQGAMYESGAYAPHGVDPTTLPTDLYFRVGHFHKKQSFGNISYLGTPRHLTKSDIGEIKGIHIYDPINNVETFMPTPESVCQPFKEIILKEGDKIPNVEFTNKTYIQLCGTKKWCEKIETKIPTGTKVYCSYTDIFKEIKVKESDGIPASFLKYFKEQNLPEEIKNEVLIQVYEACPQLRGSIG
jgi:DNA repair exonuclease SbcCD nuclease subunit